MARKFGFGILARNEERVESNVYFSDTNQHAKNMRKQVVSNQKGSILSVTPIMKSNELDLPMQIKIVVKKGGGKDA